MQGLGIDIIEIERIERVIDRHGDRFLERIYTPAEIDYCRARRHAAPSFAVRFAAKEAFAKAVEVDWQPNWTEVEVLIANRQPQLVVSERLAALLGGARLRVSLSHSDTMAAAAVVVG